MTFSSPSAKTRKMTAIHQLAAKLLLSAHIPRTSMTPRMTSLVSHEAMDPEGKVPPNGVFPSVIVLADTVGSIRCGLGVDALLDVGARLP